jgi:hypothetical protein
MEKKGKVLEVLKVLNELRQQRSGERERERRREREQKCWRGEATERLKSSSIDWAVQGASSSLSSASGTIYRTHALYYTIARARV